MDEDTDQRLRWGEHAINGYAEEKAGGLWGELYADRETVLADLLADLRHYAAVHDIDFNAVLAQSQAQGEAASLAPEPPPGLKLEKLSWSASKEDFAVKAYFRRS